ncbi:DUF1569 domain-containing protein [Chryseobacterium sp. A321]
MESLFEVKSAELYLERLKHLSKENRPLWGKMSSSQMLAHLNASFEFVFEPHKKKRPGLLKRQFLRLLVKPMVVSAKPFKKSLPTALDLKQKEEKDFETEYRRLRGYITKTGQMGTEAFEGKMHLVFGKLSAKEWNHLIGKHLDHHFRQFGV